MIKLKKIASFLIPSLAAAGAISANANTEDEISAAQESSLLDGIKKVISNIVDDQSYTLAGHSSHSSHGSHSSHSSHSSHGSHNSYNGRQPTMEEFSGEDELTNVDPTSRNEQSTPRSTILPNSPAITEKKKLKILPGNSGKFADAVTQAQIALISRGYDIGAPDGQVDAKTIAAVYDYQSQAGLIPSGKLTPETMGNLGLVVR